MHEVFLLDEGLNGDIDFGDKEDPEELPIVRHAMSREDPDELPIVRQAMSRRIAYLQDAGAPNGSFLGLKPWANGWWFDMSLLKCERRTPKSTLC